MVHHVLLELNSFLFFFSSKRPKNIIIMNFDQNLKNIKGTTLFFVKKMKQNATSGCKIELLKNYERACCSIVNSKS